MATLPLDGYREYWNYYHSGVGVVLNLLPCTPYSVGAGKILTLEGPEFSTLELAI